VPRGRPASARRLLVAVAGLLLAYVLLFTSVETVTAVPRLYGVTLESSEIGQSTGLSYTQREAVVARIAGYALGRQPDLQFTMPTGSVRAGEEAFTADELQHMADVRALFATGRFLRWLAILLSLLCLAGRAFPSPKAGSPGGQPEADSRAVVSAALRWTAGWGTGFLLAIGIVSFVDFGAAFDAMHLLLFRNDLWLLPADALLIQLLPEEQFCLLAAYSGAVFLAATAAALGLGLSLRRRLGGDARKI